MKKGQRLLDPDVLMRVTECYATGNFEVLFELEWSNEDAFIRAAKDFVPLSKWQKFETEIRNQLQK